MFKAIGLALALVLAPMGHYEEDDDDGGRRKETCFMFCDNTIIIPGLPLPGGEQEQPPSEG